MAFAPPVVLNQLAEYTALRRVTETVGVPQLVSYVAR